MNIRRVRRVGFSVKRDCFDPHVAVPAVDRAVVGKANFDIRRELICFQLVGDELTCPRVPGDVLDGLNDLVIEKNFDAFGVGTSSDEHLKSREH